MEKSKVLLIGLPIYLLCSDLFDLFTAPPPKPTHNVQSDPPPPPQYQSTQPFDPQQRPLEFPIQKPDVIGAVGVGNTVTISFCTSSSYRENAMVMKNMLETEFPAINVILANHPAALPKRLLNNLVPFFQVGMIVTIMGGEHIFAKLGMAAPSWYLSLRSNRFGSIASIWLLGNFFQSFLQTSGAFEVYCNGELVFSKLKERRLPGEIELKDLIHKQTEKSRTVDSLGDL